MKIFRRFILFAVGALGLINVVGIFLAVFAENYGPISKHVAVAALCAAACAYLIRLERTPAEPPAPEAPPEGDGPEQP